MSEATERQPLSEKPSLGNKLITIDGFLGRKDGLSGDTNPRKRKAADSEEPKKKQKADASGKAEPQKTIDISDIKLEGEEDDAVPIYETPTEVRKKISHYLRRKNVTQASFLRDIHAQVKGPRRTSRVFQGKQLSDFRGYKHVTQGNRSTLFYAAYVFFEKLRIKEGKEKSDFRLVMEQKWPNGFDVERDLGRGLCSANAIPYNDEYGKWHVVYRTPTIQRM